MNNNLEENVKDIESIRNEIIFNDNISTSCIKYNLDEIQSILNKLKNMQNNYVESINNILNT